MSLYQDAKQLYQDKKYDEAFEMIKLVISQSNSYNEYHYHLLCQISRKINQPNFFLEIIDNLIQKGVFEEKIFINDKSWCLYELYIKNYNETSNYDLLDKSKYIIDKCTQPNQDDFSNPLVLTIFRLIKYLKSQNNVKYTLIVDLLAKLDPKKLSSVDVFPFLDSNKKERELASKRERYYQDLTKAYEKIGKYDKALELCEEALKDPIEWHYDNDLWLMARKYYCECILSNNFEESIMKYRKIADDKSMWFIYHKVSNLYLSHNKIDEAIIYGCLAFDVSKDIDKKINLIYDLGLLFEAVNDNSSAKLFFQCCTYYRKINGWYINSDLKYKETYYEFDASKKPNIKELKLITVKILSKKTNRNIGEVCRIFEDKGFGFIKRNNKRDIYFKTKNIKNKKHFLEVGSFVEFDISQSGDKESAYNIRQI